MEDKELKKLAKDIFEKIKKKYYETAKEMIVANASVNTSKEIKITQNLLFSYLQELFSHQDFHATSQ